MKRIRPSAFPRFYLSIHGDGESASHRLKLLEGNFLESAELIMEGISVYRDLSPQINRHTPSRKLVHRKVTALPQSRLQKVYFVPSFRPSRESLPSSLTAANETV
jgi:hypothetical protein